MIMFYLFKLNEMEKELVMKITGMLQVIPAHAEWNIDIVGIQPTIDGLYVVYRNSDSPIQRFARLIKYCELVEE